MCSREGAEFQAARVTIDGSLASGTATWESDADMTMRTDENVRVSRCVALSPSHAHSCATQCGTPHHTTPHLPFAVQGGQRAHQPSAQWTAKEGLHTGRAT